MKPNWINIESVQQLNEILETNSDKIKLFFKHSTRCSISSMALKFFESDWKNNEEAVKWDGRFEDAYGKIEDQNFKDKWRGGDTHLTSEFQPRNPRYSFK